MKKTTNTILIVDDDPMNLRMLTTILREDYTVFAEREGKSCFKSAVGLQPDLILLDVIMPDINGFSIIKLLKEEPTTRDIPVIFITGLSEAEDEVKGFSLGAVDYINKPFNEHVVKMRVQHQIKIINLIREIQDLSITDTLTGVGNRRYLNDQLDQDWERAKRTRQPISIMIVDIDNFKQLNDRYGHLNGDIALRSTADAIKAKIERATDKLARWGGEEFAIVLPDTPSAGAQQVAENIRSAVELNTIRFTANNTCQVTISIGVHTITPLRDGSSSLDEFILRADNALYHAKSAGKNRVCVADECDKA